MNSQVLFDMAIPLQDAINQLLRPLIGSFKATTASIVDNNGDNTDVYSAIVHDDRSTASAAVPMGKVAAASSGHIRSRQSLT